ncbi:MAG TPA: hypothetical protein VFA49_15815 [Chloroflexota bacterium]|nr:hypothetical protein [Chloroflexota bacterium]
MYHVVFANEIVRQHHAELVGEAQARKARRLARRDNCVRPPGDFTWRTVRHWRFAH